MAEGKNRVAGMEIKGDCSVNINAPVSMTAGDESTYSHCNERYQCSRNNLRDLKRMNILFRFQCKREQKDRINLWSLKSINVKITEDYEDEGLSEPDVVVYPKMKKVFRFYKGDCAPKMHENDHFRTDSKKTNYIQQEGFSLHAPVHDAEDITLEQLVKIIEKRDHRLLSIVGPAGSGKTTLMRRLTKAIMQASELSQRDIKENFLARLFKRTKREYKAVLYLSFKDIPAAEKISVPELLLKNIFSDASDQEFKEGYLWLLENQSELLFVMDGFDQSSFKISDEVEKIGHWDEASTSTIVHNLFTGNLFPDAQIVFSSRENSVASLPSQLRPSFVAALVGLSSDDAERLFISLMGEEGDSAWERIRSTSSGLVRLSKIPLFLLFMAIVLKNHPNDRVHSMSGVLSRIIQILPKSNNTIKGEKLIVVLKKLMKMAFQGLKERRVTFTYDDLKRFGLDKDLIKDLVIGVPGLNTLCQNLFDGDYVFFFCHQTIQEILAAYYIRALELEEFSNFVYDFLQQDFWYVVFRILYGISLDNQVSTIISKDILPDVCHEKRNILRKAITRMLKLPLSLFQRLNLVWIISESNDAELIEAYGRKVKVEGIHISEDDIYAISSLATYLGGLDVLQLVNCGIDTELLNSMSVCFAGLKFKFVDISGNRISNTDSVALKKLLRTIPIEELVVDFPQRNLGTSNSFDLVPSVLAHIAFHVQKCHFKVKARKLFLLQNDLALLCKSTIIGPVDELHVSIEELDQSTIDDISNINDQLRMQRSESENFNCFLIIEKLQIHNNSNKLRCQNDLNGIKMLQGFIALAKSLDKLHVKHFSLQFENIDEKYENTFKTLPSSVTIETFDVSFNPNISDIGWCWLGKIVSQREIKYFNACGCRLTDSKLEKFIEAAIGAKIYQLSVTLNDEITQEGWFYIGRLLKQNGLKVLETDSNFLHSSKLKKFLDGTNGEKIDILYLFFPGSFTPSPKVTPELGVVTKISNFVREDIVICYLGNNYSRILLKNLRQIKMDAPRVWDRVGINPITCPGQRREMTNITMNMIFPSTFTPSITLTWEPLLTYSHCVYNIEAQIDSNSIKNWKNYEDTSLTVTSLPTKGILRFKITLRLCRGCDAFWQPAYSNEIDLRKLKKI